MKTKHYNTCALPLTPQTSGFSRCSAMKRKVCAVLALMVVFIMLQDTAAAQWQIGQRPFTRPASGPVVQTPLTTGQSAQGTTISGTFTAGNIVVATMYAGNDGDVLSFTDALGNTVTNVAHGGLSTDGDAVGIACMTVTTGGADTLTFTKNSSSSPAFANVYEVHGYICTPDVTFVASNTTASIACNSGPMTTSTANDFLVGACGTDGSQASTIAAGSGWSDGTNAGATGNAHLLMSEYRVGASAGSYTATSGTIISQEQGTVMVALKP